jgi:hypothetical protein
MPGETQESPKYNLLISNKPSVISGEGYAQQRDRMVNELKGDKSNQLQVKSPVEQLPESHDVKQKEVTAEEGNSELKGINEEVKMASANPTSLFFLF